jgi:ABC-type branched-subunit amino acid transport system substrate-binding protein
MKSLRWLALLVVLALGVSACGRSDDDTPTAGRTSSTEAPRPVGGDATDATFGTLTDVCQGGNPSGSPAQGVTPDEIDLSTFSDAGFSGRPGLNQELFDAAEVFSKWCNDRGGINGRKIVVHDRDAALTNVIPQMTDACREDFMTVGGGAVFDQDGVKVRLACLMPDIAGYVVSPQARGGDLTVQPVPNPVDRVGNGLYKYLAKKYPGADEAYGVITPDLPSTKEAGEQNKDVVDALGWKKAYDDVYPSLGPTSWTPYAQALKSAGVKGLIWVGEPEFLAKLIQAMNDIDYSPEFISINANNYDEGLIENAGAALKDNVYMSTPFVPFSEAKPGSATKQYLDAFARYLPDGKARAAYGAQAFSAWLLFARAAKACGNDLTRKCVYENAKQVTDWTGGGLHSPQDVKDNTVGTCITVLQATKKGFVRVKDLSETNGIFHCAPGDVHRMKSRSGDGMTLQDVGESMSDFK